MSISISRTLILKINPMNLNKIFYNILIAAFIYLVICPAVHNLGDNIKHDLCPKVGAEKLKKDFKKGFNVTFSKLSNITQPGFFIQSWTEQKLSNLSSFHFTLSLSTLSTIRLILWFPYHNPSTVSWYRDRSFFYSHLLHRK